MNDLRFVFRQLLKNRAAPPDVLALALGIGANVAMFSFVNAMDPFVMSKEFP